jgi:CheY-like chemotaxis protein
LLAEDNQTNQVVALYLLNKLGYHADVVKNGLEVLNSIQSTNYDIILMDCQMPEMDGYMATEFIRNNINLPKSKQPVIIAMTAHALKGDKEKCLGAGMDDYISKPINIDVLKATLDRWVSKMTTCDIQLEPDQNYIDVNRIKEIFGDDTSNIISFFDTFINSTTIILDNIDDSIKTKNVDALKQDLHKLKGSAFNCGIVKIGNICADAEINLDKKNWDYLGQIYFELQKCFSHVKNEILRFNNCQGK